MKKLLAVVLCLVLAFSCLSACAAKEEATAPAAAPAATEAAKEEAKAPAATEAAKEEAASTEPIYVALHCPITGDAAQYGDYISNGFMCAIDECNNAGGINGRQIVVDIFDSKNDSAEASTLATKIVEDEKYICAVGDYTSTTSLAVAPIYSEAGMLHFCPTAGSMQLPEYDHTFTMAMGEKYEFDLFAKLAAGLAGQGGKAGFIHQTNDNGIASMEVVSECMPKYGAEIVFTDSYNEGEVRDFTAIVTKVKDANLDLICMNATYAEQSSFLIQLRNAGCDTPVLFSSPANCAEFIDAAGEYAEGCYTVATFSYLDPAEGTQKFVKEFEGRTGNGQPTSFAQQPYEQGCMLVKALQEGATDRQSLFDTVSSWTTWDGPTIQATFRENGSLERSSLTLLLVKDGKWTVVE